jgi:hypothetical protein
MKFYLLCLMARCKLCQDGLLTQEQEAHDRYNKWGKDGYP